MSDTLTAPDVAPAADDQPWAKLAAIRPTQMTVGMAEVARKRRHFEALNAIEAAAFLEANPLPAALGPKGHHYIIDHHHLGLALLESGVARVTMNVVADLSHLDKDEFWIIMAERRWTHCYDNKGVPRAFEDMPRRLKDLADDPFRSLAAEVRRAGGYPKDTHPFSEFVWADFFRRRLPASAVRAGSHKVLEEAVTLAKSREAAHLPHFDEAGTVAPAA